MKRFAVSLMILMVSAALAGCASGGGDDNVITVSEKFFIQQTNDIYLNPNRYDGKTIRIEGMYSEVEEGGVLYRFVYRFGPGCCGNDGVIFMDFIYDGEYPQPDEWIKIEGVVETEERELGTYVYLNLTALEVSEKRGTERVYS